MKKFAMVGMTLAVAAVFVLSGPFQTQASAQQPIVMKLASANPVGDIKDLVSLKMAELVKQKTNGRVIVEVYSGGQLGDWREAIEGLGLGVTQIVIESVGTIEPYTKMALIETVPYLFDDIDQFQKVWLGPLGRKMLDAIGDDGNFKILSPMNRGARVVTSKKPFTNLAELKGLKIRVPNMTMYISTWKALGAAPMPLALTEVFTALQQNTVEAQENPTIESYGHSFYDVCQYLVETDHLFGADVFFFNKQYFEKLPADIQKAIIEACDEAAAWRNKETLAKEAEFKKMFEAKGVKIIKPERAEFAAACAKIVEQEYPYLLDWFKEIKALR